jgi:hypothetical protein
VNARALLADVVADLRRIPPMLSGDDSDLADAWEEIKYQVQGEHSFIWPAYLDTVKGAIDGAVARRTPEELSDLSTELRTPMQDGSRIRRALLLRLLARARKRRSDMSPLTSSTSGTRTAKYPFTIGSSKGLVCTRVGFSLTRLLSHRASRGRSISRRSTVARM